MKKIFLDCGSHQGEGFEHFNKIYGDEFEYHLFEPNPNNYSILEEKYNERENLILSNNAVLDEETEREFHFETYTKESWGGSLVDAHNNGTSFVGDPSKTYDAHDENHVTRLTVKCINLSDYINNLYEDDCEIVVKLDVESSEYDIIESLIETKVIDKIKTLYCEFHTQYMVGESKNIFLARENKIKEYMQTNNVDFHLWDQ